VVRTVAPVESDMNLNQTVIFSPDVISQEVSGETVLLDLESECYFGLDAVGTRIWQLIRTSGDLRTIYSTLLEEYEVEETQLQTDLESLLTEACARGLITLQAAP
jgi:Coenzyme PQQ synthesis protein D (PqqD)